MDENDEMLALYEPVYAFVRTVPPGKVVTYGQVADCLTAVRLTARQVGTAMRYAPPDVPWQRVVGAGGRLPIAKLSPEAKVRQRDLLLAEGVRFYGRKNDGRNDEINGADGADRVDMAHAQWDAPTLSDGTGDLFGRSGGDV
jgi:methylated-DNA-protein-cysteine methyltransferase related protein